MDLETINEVSEQNVPDSYYDPTTDQLDITRFYNDTIGENTTFTKQELEGVMNEIKERTKELQVGTTTPPALQKDRDFLESLSKDQFGKDPSHGLNKNIVRVLKMMPGIFELQSIPLGKEDIVLQLSAYIDDNIISPDKSHFRKVLYGVITSDEHMRKNGYGTNTQRKITKQEMGEVLKIVSGIVSWGF